MNFAKYSRTLFFIEHLWWLLLARASETLVKLEKDLINVKSLIKVPCVLETNKEITLFHFDNFENTEYRLRDFNRYKMNRHTCKLKKQ